jgi:predicted porin
MKKALAAGAALVSLAGSAHAVGFEKDGVSIDLYGVLDAGYGYLEHSYGGNSDFPSTVNPYSLNSSSSSFSGVYSGGVSMSRWGVKGGLDLGSGRRAFFTLESALDVVSGQTVNAARSVNENVGKLNTANGASSINGQLFSRGAYLGVSDPVAGSLSLGRTTNFSLDQASVYDPIQDALLFSPLGFSGGIGGGLGATENARLDNSIKYQGKFAGVDVGLQYKHGGGEDAQSAGRAYVGMLGYVMGPASVQATYMKTENSVVWGTGYSNVVAPSSNVTIENTNGFMVSGLYHVTDDATAKIGYEYTRATAPSNPNLTSIQSYYGINLLKPGTNASGVGATRVFWIGGDYKVTSALDVGVGYYNVDNYNDPEAGKQYRANIGSLLVDYTFNKSFDTYFGLESLNFSGPGLVKQAPVDAYSSNTMIGAGMRVKF